MYPENLTKAADESRLVAQQDLLNLNAAKHFLRGLLARLDDDDEITLETGDEDPRRWTPTVKALLDGDLDAVLQELPADIRLYVANRSRDRAFALATFDTVDPATFVLDLGDRRVSVAVLEEPVEDDRIEDAWISVPGFGGVEIVSEGECVDLGDELERVYADAFAEEVEDEVVEDGDPPSGGIVEGHWSEETAARTVTLAVNKTAKAKYKWRNITSTLGEFAEMMLTHPEDASKDGMSILQGELIGEERNKKAVRACYFMALDLDTGEDEEKVWDRVQKLGKCAFLYSTHSHMKTQDEVAKQNVLKFADGAEIDDELLARHLREERGVRRQITESVRIVETARHTADGVRIVFDHAPWPKFRLFFPLRDPFVFAERTPDADLQKALAEWKGKLYGLGQVLGVRIDTACVDPSRLFYTPRHKPGAPFTSRALLTDDLLSVDDVPTIDGRHDNPFDQAAEWMLKRGRKIEISEENRWLFGWAKRYGAKFEIDEWLHQYLPDYVLGDRPSGAGVTTLCPHHETRGAHSSEGGSGTFAAPADPVEDRGFVWHCTHDHCRDLDKLNFLDLILQEGLVEKRDLFDPSFLMLEQGEEDPEEWDVTSTVSVIDTTLAAYEAKKIAWPDVISRLGMEVAVMPSDQLGGLVNRLSQLGQVDKRVVKKELLTSAEIAKAVTRPRNRPGWWRKLVRQSLTLNGETIEGDAAEPCAYNVGIYLEYHDLLKERVLLDRLRTRPRVVAALPWDAGDRTFPRDWTDADLSCLRCWFQALDRDDRLMLFKEDVADGFVAYVQTHGYDPVLDYLEGLEWDGRKRLDKWLSAYCGADDTPLNQAIGTKWMISAVARQMEPGCQCKYVMVLESPQDAGKSKALKILGGEWFTDNVRRLDDKDTAMIVQTNWIVELSELASVRGSKGVEEVKAFISRTEDEYRAPYGRFNIKRPRQCVFAGTTNEKQYLSDPTGNVRFWPVRCAAEVDTAALERDRDQMWAEARHCYEQGERWWFDPTEEKDLLGELRAAQEARTDEDPLFALVLHRLTHKRVPDPQGREFVDPVWEPRREGEMWDGFTAAELLDELGIDFRTQRSGEIRVGKILHKLGFEQRREQGGGVRIRRYFRCVTDSGR